MSLETSSFLDISAIESPSILSWRIEYALDMLIIPSRPPWSIYDGDDQGSPIGVVGMFASEVSKSYVAMCRVLS